MAKRKRSDSQSKVVKQKKQSSGKGEAKESPDKAKDEVVHLEISTSSKIITCALKNPESKPLLICTHGAGGTIDSPGMTDVLVSFPAYICFQGSMNMKARVTSFHAVIEHFDVNQALGGWSMGARAAVTTALEMDTKPDALILISYPLTNGKGERQPAQREQILLDLPGDIDVLFATGTEDHQCPMNLLLDVMKAMKAQTYLLALKGADHGTSIKPKAAIQPMRAELGAIAARWLESKDNDKRFRSLAWDKDQRCTVSEGWERTAKGITE